MEFKEFSLFCLNLLFVDIEKLLLEFIFMIKNNLIFAFVGDTQTKRLKTVLKSTLQFCNISKIISEYRAECKTCFYQRQQ